MIYYGVMPGYCIMQEIWIAKESVCSIMSEPQLTSSILGIEVFPFTQALSTSISAHIYLWLVTTELRWAYLIRDRRWDFRKCWKCIFSHQAFSPLSWSVVTANVVSLDVVFVINYEFGPQSTPNRGDSFSLKISCGFWFIHLIITSFPFESHSAFTTNHEVASDFYRIRSMKVSASHFMHITNLKISLFIFLDIYPENTPQCLVDPQTAIMGSPDGEQPPANFRLVTTFWLVRSITAHFFYTESPVEHGNGNEALGDLGWIIVLFIAPVFFEKDYLKNIKMVCHLVINEMDFKSDISIRYVSQRIEHRQNDKMYTFYIAKYADSDEKQRGTSPLPPVHCSNGPIHRTGDHVLLPHL